MRTPNDGLRSYIYLYLFLDLATIVYGQDATSTATSHTSTKMVTTTSHNPQNAPSLAATAFNSQSMVPLPSASDAAPKGNDNKSSNSTGLVNYYFVFLALIVAVVGLAVFLVMRRRHRAMLRSRYGQQVALTRDLGGSRQGGGWSDWNPERTTGGRYWQGRWRSAEASREEGLNEQGEAPPPYIPKRRSQEAQRNEEREQHEPAIPLQTLSRQDAGLKPPDYSELHSQDPNSHVRNSSVSAASAESSRDAERRTSP